ncbi:MAG: phage portal protein, partial [bacterium]|nr:phage portal protein [bacterium]
MLNLDTGQARLMILQQMANEIDEEAEKVKFYRDLYDGLIGAMLTRRQQLILGGDDNPTDKADFLQTFIPLVVDVPAERMIVKGFEFKGDDSLNGEDADPALWWEQNRMDAMQLDVHTACRRDGYTHILVTWDNEKGRPEFTHELAFDSTYDGMRVHYDPENPKRILAATKRWTTRDERGEVAYRRNIYYPHLIQKWVNRRGIGGSNEAFWEPFIEDGDEVIFDEETSEYVGIDWTDSDGSPIGVPVIAFNNRPNGYKQGISAIERARGAQAAKNKADIDLIAAADAAAFPIYALFGDSLTDGGDEDNDVSNPVTISPGEVLEFPNSDTGDFVKIEPTSLGDLRDTSNFWVHQMLALCRIPPSYIYMTSQVQSSDGQQQNDVPLLSMIKADSIGIGNGWEDVMRAALKLDNVFGGAKHDLDNLVVETKWKD